MLCLVATLLIAGPQLGWRAGTPEPVLEGEPGWVRMYWKAWENLHEAVILNDGPGRMPYRFIGPNSRIDFDETLHIALWARWAWRAFPIAETAEFSLSSVEASGFAPAFFYFSAEPEGIGEATGLPLCGLSLWGLYSISGDGDLLTRNLASAARRHTFLLGQYTVPAEKEGEKERLAVPAAHSALIGATPGALRTDSAEAVALILQDAAHLRMSAAAMRLRDTERVFAQRAQAFASKLAALWDADASYYSGRDAHNDLAERLSLVPFWGMLGGSMAEPLNRASARTLGDPRLFATRMPYPLLPRTDPAYNSGAGVRPLYQYLTLRALLDAGERAVACRAAESILRGYEAAAGEKQALFGNYGPDTRMPAEIAGRDSLEAGLIVVGALLEAIIGIEPAAGENTVHWNLWRTDRHGIRNLRFGDNVVSLVATERDNRSAPAEIEIECEKPFTLKVTAGSVEQTVRFREGKHTYRAGR